MVGGEEGTWLGVSRIGNISARVISMVGLLLFSFVSAALAYSQMQSVRYLIRSSREIQLGNHILPKSIAGYASATYSTVKPFYARSQTINAPTRNIRPYLLAMGGLTMAAYMCTHQTADCEAEMKGDKQAEVKDAYAHTALFPPIQAYEKSMLRVSNIHTIAYSLYGNPKGKPVLFVHGGPGGGTDPGEKKEYLISSFFV
jgi:hypothetical protein